MGFFKELALLPVAPLRGTVAIADLLAQEADRSLYASCCSSNSTPTRAGSATSSGSPKRMS
jgi:hypothetical protein